MRPRRRTIAVTLGLLSALAVAGCAGYQPTGYGDQGGAAPAAGTGPTPAPTPTAAAAGANAAAAVGSLTDRLSAKKIPRMGAVVTDAKGWVLYRFDKDTANPPATNCAGDCALVWPPVLTGDGNPAIEGIAPDLVGTVSRADGGNQLTIAGWPLYRYAGDQKPGQWKGQAVSGTWFVVLPTGKKNLTCLPTSTPTPVGPPATAGTGGYGS